MLSLLLTVLCSTSIGLILRHNSARDGNALQLLTGNYLMASIISGLFLIGEPGATVSGNSILFGSGMAILFVSSFFAYAKAVGAAGTALASVSSRLSLILPVVLSIIIFGEKLNGLRYIGIILTIATIYFFYLSLKSKSENGGGKQEYLYLLLLFLGIGIGDFGMKIFGMYMPSSDKPVFLLSIFGFSFIYCLVMLAIDKTPVKRAVVIRGMTLGISKHVQFFLPHRRSSKPPCNSCLPCCKHQYNSTDNYSRRNNLERGFEPNGYICTYYRAFGYCTLIYRIKKSRNFRPFLNAI